MDKKIQTAILSRAELQHGLITRGQALERGLKSADIHRQVAKGRWETLGRGVYRIGGTPKTYEQSVKAVTFARSGAVAHLRTAARLYGLPIGEFEEVEIAIVRRTRARTVEGVTVRLLPRLDAVDRSRPSGSRRPP
ncbi:MAG TPA: type IV toxin-antitoxin system AbiEi family antitoxin domain-containing protein [Actinomycetota bacterium]|nr:type IV toxin-antitoxin system AbiEi family antitoxin domain-containing protein [Actinomycetota bacterium]